MIELTIEEFEAAPKQVQFLYIMATQGFPVNIDKYNEIKYKYPYYFEVRSNSQGMA